jgi:hypothetical protein
MSAFREFLSNAWSNPQVHIALAMGLSVGASVFPPLLPVAKYAVPVLLGGAYVSKEKPEGGSLHATDYAAILQKAIDALNPPK